MAKKKIILTNVNLEIFKEKKLSIKERKNSRRGHIEAYRKSLDDQCECGYFQQVENEIKSKHINHKQKDNRIFV